jgi:hypothetical protein
MIGGKTFDLIEIDLRDAQDRTITLYIDVFESSLARKWLAALDRLLSNRAHLEKNYCFMGFVNHGRDGRYLLDAINTSIAAINEADIGYHIHDHFSLENTISDEPTIDYRGAQRASRNINHQKFNQLHRYFEDLQGQSGQLSQFYQRANAECRWHIRQLNLLCHEFESWALSFRKQLEAPDWQRPSQLMCWLNSQRFVLEEEDYEMFGVETINRPTGGVFVGVNKSVGKHHWEVYVDEGRDSHVDQLTTSALISQTEAAGDFDIEWGQDPAPYAWQQERLQEFRQWLRHNGFDPDDKKLTIGHPQVGQVDLSRSFGTQDFRKIWQKLDNYLDVYSVRTSKHQTIYDYRWDDPDYPDQQIAVISGEHQ